MDLSEVEKLEQGMQPLDEAGELLMAAANLIEQRGLERIGYQGENGSLCVQGALMMAHGGDFLKSRYMPRLGLTALSRLHQLIGGPEAYMWIRRPEVSKETVVAKMREAALLS